MTTPIDLTAILVGCALYPPTTGLENIPPVSNNLQKFIAILTDPAIFGVPNERVHCLLDPQTGKSFASFVKSKSELAEGTLLFYYAGHGVIAYDGTLLFPTRETEKYLEEETSVAWELIKRRLINSPARRRILILDCCYSSRAVGALAGETAELRAPLAAEGAIAITAAPRNKTAHFLAGETYTAFSGRFFTVLENGVPDRGDLLTADTIFEETKRLVNSHGNLPEPQIVVSGVLGNIKLARNKAFLATRPDEDAEWIARIRQQTAAIGERFADKVHESVDRDELQLLARPIRKWGLKLSRLGLVEELFDTPRDPRADRDAAVFVAALIVHERRAEKFLDRLVALASAGKPVRSAAMWRILKAIRRLVRETELSEERRQRLLQALTNCARKYDSDPGKRFVEQDILSLVRDIAKLRGARLSKQLGEIFDLDQLRELSEVPPRSRRGLATTPPESLPAAVPQLAGAPGPETSVPGLRSSLLSQSSGILADRLAETKNILSSLSGFSTAPTPTKPGKGGS